MLSLIAIIGKNRELGRDNHLLWNIPSDLKHFREITRGHPVIMGRKTFQSIGRPLPKRANFVITRDANFQSTGVTVVPSLDVAIEKAKNADGAEEIFVIGGGSVYGQAIEKAGRLYLTIVDASVADADTFFPEYSAFTKIVSEESHDENGFHFIYRILERR